MVNNQLAAAAADQLPVTATIVVEGLNSRGDIAGLTTGTITTQSSFRGSVSDSDGNTNSASFLSSDFLSINASIYVDQSDIRKTARIYTLVLFENSYFMKNSNGNFLAWDGSLDSLVASETDRPLADIETFSVISGLMGIVGDFEVTIAYSTDDGVFRYSQSPISFVVTQQCPEFPQ